MKEQVVRFTRIFFNGVTIEGVALWLRTLIATVWGAIGGVAFNVAMQWAGGGDINWNEVARAALGVAIPVLIAFLWPSRARGQITMQETTTTTTTSPYVAQLPKGLIPKRTPEDGEPIQEEIRETK